MNERDGSGILALVQKFNAVPFLSTLLQACFVLHFDLLRPRPDKPTVAIFEMGIEPADMADLLTLFLSPQDLAQKIDSVLQLNAFCPLTPEEAAAITPRKQMIWCDAIAAQGGCTVVLAEAMALAKAAAPWKIPSGIAGKIGDVPFNIESCLEIMREDVTNAMSLRAEMRRADIQLIYDVQLPAD
ncbi:hypothetical protein B0H13DRAFT_2329786 [Mycena leptocephala]|nr:hypothetical protein B0H13DRAFT_2329786 [Mycena leptocephala]